MSTLREKLFTAYFCARILLYL